jgi:UDP-N-acetylglucosamine acyltransferase
MAAARVHPSAVIGDGVTLGADVVVGPGAVLLGPLKIGDRVWIGPQVVIGTPPEMGSQRQNAAWEGDLDHCGVEIGDDVVIRELSTIHQGSHRTTTIGTGSWLLNSVYVAHDCLIGAEVTLSAGVRVGGHAIIGAHCNLGMNASVHQYRVIGAGSMIGMGSPVTHDLPPFAKAYGSPIRRHGLNTYVLNKLGVSPDAAAALAEAYDRGDFSLTGADADPALVETVTWWQAQSPQRLAGSESIA